MIHYSTEPGSPVVEITAEGHITNEELTDVMDKVGVEFERNGKTRIIEIIEHFTGIEPAAIWTDLKRAPHFLPKVSRVAVVADQAWIRGVTELGHLFTRAELKAYAPEELAQARAWIAAD